MFSGTSACARELQAKVAACTANMTTVYCKKETQLLVVKYVTVMILKMTFW
jgi:hypothetical protein